VSRDDPVCSGINRDVSGTSPGRAPRFRNVLNFGAIRDVSGNYAIPGKIGGLPGVCGGLRSFTPAMPPSTVSSRGHAVRVRGYPGLYLVCIDIRRSPASTRQYTPVHASPRSPAGLCRGVTGMGGGVRHLPGPFPCVTAICRGSAGLVSPCRARTGHESGYVRGSAGICGDLRGSAGVYPYSSGVYRLLPVKIRRSTLATPGNVGAV